MIFARFSKPKKVEVKVTINRATYDLIEDLKTFYRLPLNELIESLICTDHEDIRIRRTRQPFTS